MNHNNPFIWKRADSSIVVHSAFFLCVFAIGKDNSTG